MNNTVTFDELYNKEFDVYIYNSAKQYWNFQNNFSCMDAPKTNDMFLFYNCLGEYKTSEENIFTATLGNIVYAPRGSRYETRFFDTSDEEYSTILINFDLLGNDGKPFSLSDKVELINDIKFAKYENMFLDMVSASAQNIRFPAGLKSGFYRIIAELCRHFHRRNIFSDRYQVISKGIIYLEESEDISLSVNEISKMCNVSEIYFRKLFKEYAGISPSQFKINKKIEKAKQYLAFENKSLRETADILGFNDTAYFCRLFKEKTGLTPGEYIDRQTHKR